MFIPLICFLDLDKSNVNLNSEHDILLKVDKHNYATGCIEIFYIGCTSLNTINVNIALVPCVQLVNVYKAKIQLPLGIEYLATVSVS